MIRINLLPQEERAQKRKLALPHVSAVVPFVAMALFLAGIVAVTAVERTKIAGLKRDIVRAEDEARRLKPQIDKVNELTRRREDLNSRLQIIQNLDKGRFHSVRLMDEVAQELPSYMWLTGMKDQAGTRLTIDGVTYSNLVVADLMTRLGKSTVFRNIDLVVTEKGQIEGRQVTKFSVTAEIVPGSTTSSMSPGPVASWLDDPEGSDGH